MSVLMLTSAIAVMAKAPQAGRSKRQLCPPLPPQQCAERGATFLRDNVENMTAAARLATITPYAAHGPLGAEDTLARAREAEQ